MTGAPSPLIEVEGIERRYGRLTAVAGVSFEAAPGEVLALLGPNGAGKSTALAILSGNLAPHGGRVRIAGHDLLSQPRAAKRRLGYLPERPPVYPELTVTEYLRFCARLRGIRRSGLDRAVREAAERTEVAAVGGRLIGHLSKGYQQRVGIAQAIVHRPSVIVLDEPTVGLDPVQIRHIRTLIGELAGDAAIIVSTHLLPEAGEIASRLVILNRGRVAYRGPIASAPSDPRRLRIELARPPQTERLSALPGVARAEPAGAGAFLVTAAPGADPRTALARAALDQDWGLLALTPYAPSLEEIFLTAAGA